MKRNCWDAVAARYDETTNQVYKEANKKVINRTLKYCDLNTELLDIGCGTGLLTMSLAKNVQSVDAVDLSKKMLDIARQKVATNHITNVNWIDGDLFDKKLNNKKYDMITAFNVLLYIDKPDIFIAECFKHLKKGGYFALVTDCLEETKMPKKLMYEFGKILGRLNLMPKYKMFSRQSVDEFFINKNFKVLHNENVYITPPNYLIIAQKVGDHHGE